MKKIIEHVKVKIPVGRIVLDGDLTLPENSNSLILFSHGSGSSRHSPRNKFVAGILNQNGFATLLIDLLTEEEDSIYENRFNIELLTERLIAVTKHLKNQENIKHYKIGYFGASTGAACALIAAAKLKPNISAVISRGGRPDLAGNYLKNVEAPTLLIIGGLDTEVIELNKMAFNALNCEKELTIVNGATHLFEEDDKLEQVAHLATNWYNKHLSKFIVTHKEH